MSIHQQYREAGFFVFPLNKRKLPNKIPAVTGWQKYNEEFNESDPYGAAIPPNIVVVDIDPRNFPDGVNVWEELKKDFNVPTDTFVVQTYRGGLHLYFHKPEEVNLANGLTSYPGIEFKAHGKFVVGAGTVIDNTPYAVLQGDLNHLLQLPSLLIEALRKDRSTMTAPEDLEMDSVYDKSRYINYLNGHPGAVEGQNGDIVTVKVAAIGKDFGLSEALTFELMAKIWNKKCSPEWDLDELRQKVHNGYAHCNQTPPGAKSMLALFPELKRDPNIQVLTSRIQFSKQTDNNGNAIPRKLLTNLVTLLELDEIGGPNNTLIPNPLKGLVKMNTFSHDIEVVKAPPWKRADSIEWTDADTAALKFNISQRSIVEFSSATIWEAMAIVARAHQYHPVRDWLNSLQWDGKNRLHNYFAQYLGCPDNAYTSAVGGCFLIGAVARVFNPGCKVDTMPILEGPQGIGKSTFCSVLAGPWFADPSVDVTDTQAATQVLMGKWIVELQELDFMARSEVQALKRFITTKVDRVRLPYLRAAADYPRQSVFIGTINPDAATGYLKDKTGNRRFLPISCTSVDIPGLEQNRNQIFAEAVHRYKQGEPWYITDPMVLRMAEMEAEARREVDLWEQAVAAYLAERPEMTETTTALILVDALGIPPRAVKQSDMTRVGWIMKALGWDVGRVTVNNLPCRGFVKQGDK